MKVSKLITLDSEIVEALKNCDNASKLINDYLRDHFCKTAHMKKQEIIDKRDALVKEISKQNINLNAMNAEIKKLISEEIRLNEILKDIPKEIIDDFQVFPDMTETILYMRFEDIYHPKFPELKFPQVLKALKEKNAT